MMRWNDLLSARRPGAPEPDPAHRPRTPFQVDHDRIIFSSAFRRLQDKTQVFPLAESDFVRTRLTHSLEVSCVGRSLGTRVGEEILRRHDIPHRHESDFGAIVAAASLAHDLGNPPFGHSGEDAMRHWFLCSPVARALHGCLTPVQHADFARYEGNAHAFRVVTRLQMADSPGGMQLTCATLGALAKYPLPSAPPTALAHRGASTKKFNFFEADRARFAETARHLGLLERAPDAWARHPLAFLVEAADDICYRIVDFEDAYRHDVIPFEEVRDAFLAICDSPSTRDRLPTFAERKRTVEFLRAKTIGRLVEQAANAFLAREPAILDGSFDEPLIDAIPATPALEAIDARSRDCIYSNRHVVGTEVAGFEVIGRLLDVFVAATEEVARDPAHASRRARKTLELLPDQFLGPRREPDPDPYLRLLGLMDFIAGMTDTYAVALFQKVSGMSL